MDPPQHSLREHEQLESESEPELVNDSLDEACEAWMKYPDKPSRFKAVIISASSNPYLDIESYDDVMEEWSFDNEYEGHSDFCICSQEIEHQFFLKNEVTGNVIIVGSECIKKFGTDEQGKTLQAIERRQKYTGDKTMCCSCMKNKVSPDRAHRAVPLCESCIGETPRPSTEYMKAFGVPCIVCLEERVIGGSLITCCLRCKQYSCIDCNSPLHNSTRGMKNAGWYQKCPYCYPAISVGIYCKSCRIPLTKKQGETYGNIECSKCHFRRPGSRHSPRATRPIKHCPTCNQMKEFANMEAWCKKCIDCFKKSKLA